MAALADLPGLAARISSDLTRESIPHLITGAVAMASMGYVRATQDLDILVVTTAIQLPRVFEIVRKQGFERDDRQLIEAIRERYVAALHAGPVTVKIEDLIVLKMLWRRAKDVPDVHALIATTADLDGRYITETLDGIRPAGDPRHAEIEGLLCRFAPE